MSESFSIEKGSGHFRMIIFGLNFNRPDVVFRTATQRLDDKIN